MPVHPPKAWGLGLEDRSPAPEKPQITQMDADRPHFSVEGRHVCRPYELFQIVCVGAGYIPPALKFAANALPPTLLFH